MTHTEEIEVHLADAQPYWQPATLVSEEGTQARVRMTNTGNEFVISRDNVRPTTPVAPASTDIPPCGCGCGALSALDGFDDGESYTVECAERLGLL